MEHFPAFTVSLFLFAGFTVFSAGQHVKTYYVEAGSKSFTLPLPTVYKAEPGDNLTWKRNEAVVRKGSESGALELPAEDLKVAGQVHVYTLEVFNKDGQLKFDMKCTLHLLEKVGIPHLSFDCLDEVVVFNCSVSQIKDLVYAWTVNNVTQSKKTPTFKVQWEDIEKSVRCTVSNKAGKKDSQEVIAVCGEKVGIPHLSFDCLDEVVVFNCSVSQIKDLVYAWTVNNVTQSEKTSTLKVQWKDIEKSVRCTVSNKAGKKDSQEVIAVCGGAVTTRTTSSKESGGASFEGAVRAVGVSHVLECFQLNVVGVLVLLLLNRGLV